MRLIAMVVRLATALVIITIIGTLLAGAAEVLSESAVPVDARRGAEQTLLTYPEWFLVHSPAEYASLVSHRPSHEFPFLTHIDQFWSSYGAVVQEQKHAGYPMNFGYHVMIWVIGTSTTLEYVLRSAYENAIGRISWALSSRTLTEEDVYESKVAQDYVDFIRREPWYLYDFTSKLAGLWRDTPLWGPDVLRKWERRYALTTEYLVKALYGKLIEKATRAAYIPALMTTDVVVDRVPQAISQTSHISVLQTLPGGRALLSLPRYFEFRIAATELANQGVHLLDIAGNTSVILVTVWVNDQSKIDVKSNRILFEQPLVTMPGNRRLALLVPVGRLSEFLLAAPKSGVKVEHVYDY